MDSLPLALSHLPSLKEMGVAAGLSFVNFVLHSSLFDTFFLSKLRYKLPALFGKPKWISNITGTPSCVDDVTTAMVGPFPELNDFNAITAMVPLPVVLKGLPPTCRYWSIQAFLKDAGELVSGDQIVCDEEFELDSDGTYTLTISKEKPETGSWINSGDATLAKMIVIRAFCVSPGKNWRTPSLFRGGVEVAMAETERVAGPPALWRAESTGPVNRLSKVVHLNALALLAAPSMSRSVVFGAAGTVLMRRYLLNKVAKKMKGALLGVRKLVPNETVSRPAARASLGGSAKHAYFTMIYDARSSPVTVQGVQKYVKSGKQMFRYASVTCYEFTSLPLPGYFDDRSLVTFKGSGGKEMYDVVLTTRPTMEEGVNEIDVSKQPVGVVVVRLVYPENDAVLDECKPTIKAVTGKEKAN